MMKYTKIEQMVHEKALKKKLFLGPLRRASGQKIQCVPVSCPNTEVFYKLDGTTV